MDVKSGELATGMAGAPGELLALQGVVDFLQAEREHALKNGIRPLHSAEELEGLEARLARPGSGQWEITLSNPHAVALREGVGRQRAAARYILGALGNPEPLTSKYDSQDRLLERIEDDLAPVQGPEKPELPHSSV